MIETIGDLLRNIFRKFFVDVIDIWIQEPREIVKIEC
jgi:hypothetical protein